MTKTFIVTVFDAKTGEQHLTASGGLNRNEALEIADAWRGNQWRTEVRATEGNKGPLMTPPEGSGYAALPAHSPTSEGWCFYCEETPEWESFAAYRTWWYENEYEGEGTGEFGAAGHRHHDQENWEYLHATCLG